MWAICLDCHGNSAAFLAESGHEGVIPGVLQGETTCSECHELSHLPPEERSSK